MDPKSSSDLYETSRKDLVSSLSFGGLPEIAEQILGFLDGCSLAKAEIVCLQWKNVIADGNLWYKLLEKKVRSDPRWGKLARRSGWMSLILKDSIKLSSHEQYRSTYASAARDLLSLDQNWKSGNFKTKTIELAVNEKVCSFDSFEIDCDYIVCSFRNKKIKVWDRENLDCVRTFESPEHIDCLRLNNGILVGSTSGNCTVRVWEIMSGELASTLTEVGRAVTDLAFNETTLVICFLRGSIKAWKIIKPSEVVFGKELAKAESFVFKERCVKLDQYYILCADKHGSIDVWKTCSLEFVGSFGGDISNFNFFRPLSLHYRYPLAVFCFPTQITLTNIENGVDVKMSTDCDTSLLRIDSNRIVCYSGLLNALVVTITDIKTSKFISRFFIPIMEILDGVKSDDFAVIGAFSDLGSQHIGIWDFLHV